MRFIARATIRVAESWEGIGLLTPDAWACVIEASFRDRDFVDGQYKTRTSSEPYSDVRRQEHGHHLVRLSASMAICAGYDRELALGELWFVRDQLWEVSEEDSDLPHEELDLLLLAAALDRETVHYRRLARARETVRTAGREW